MSNRIAKNIEYGAFLTSVRDCDDEVVSSKLEIPEFQRNYVWKTNNIKDLVDSIDNNQINYYLGNIVIIKKETGGRTKIVDGQQRLVTLSLLAKILVNKTNDSVKQNKLKSLIWADDQCAVFRILFNKENLKNVYENLLLDIQINESNLSDVQVVLWKAFSALKEEVRLIQDIELFIDKLISLEFVVIKSLSDEDAYQLFEGLNSTGLSLSAVELTKNAILGKVKQLNPEKIDEALLIWDSIEKKFEDIDISWFKKFLRHQWFSKNGYTSDSELFREIKNNIINRSGITSEEIIEYLKELEDDASVYISFRTANLNKAMFNTDMSQNAWNHVNKLIGYIEKLGLDQVYSFLLSLYKYGKNHDAYFLRGESFKIHIEKLWSFLLIVKYTKVSPSSFERHFAKTCKDIQQIDYSSFKNKMDDLFRDKLKSKVMNLGEDFSVKLSNSVDYFNDDRDMIRFIVEEYLLFEGAGADSQLTTEHILPENNLEEWRDIADLENAKKFVGNIGNLTLLNEDLNEDAGHKNFNEKYETAYKNSRYTVNNKLRAEWGDGFCSPDPVSGAIIPRGKKIGESIYDNYLLRLG